VLEAAELHLHVAYEQLCLVERGCDGYVIRVASLPDMTGRYLCVVHVQAEGDGRHVFPELSSPYVTMSR
jgi:hypothetical protein